jgi:hypothetical protein
MREKMEQQKKQEDSGYGGYKKGHGIKDDWISQNQARQIE